MTVDHLVIMAASLEQGVAWCEATLGVTPGPGGEHPLMGTHNRLLKIATQDFPQAYFEIIAINSGATNTAFTRPRRWFDMDEPAVRERVQRDGPQLIHWVAAVNDIAATVATLAAQNVDRGEVLHASRQTPSGLTLHGLRPPQADALHQALATIGLPTMAVTDGPAQLSATLQTPKGLIEIHT